MSKNFLDDLDFIPQTEVATASGKKLDTHGRVRKTIFLPPDLIADIESAFERDGYTRLMDFYHWIMIQGWEAYTEGKRPSANRQASNEITI